MNFKNELEQRCYEIARDAIGSGISIEHNKTIKIESALFPEVASFKGPPAKEVDILVAEILEKPRVALLVSCKMLTRKAEPAHVQEWCSVVQTMNKYADGTQYIGLVLSPTGFTAGCEAWATSHNIGILPPLKGRRLAFNEETVLRMFGRVVKALRTRVQCRFDDLAAPPAFFDFVFRIVADFEGHQEVATSSRYFMSPRAWSSSFGEMYSSIGGRKVQDLLVVRGASAIRLSGDLALQFSGNRVDFGPDLSLLQGDAAEATCRKNIEMDPCTLEFVKSIVIDKTISSAGDFGGYLEFGLDQRFNLGLHPSGFHLFSTETPIEQHRL